MMVLVYQVGIWPPPHHHQQQQQQHQVDHWAIPQVLYCMKLRNWINYLEYPH